MFEVLSTKCPFDKSTLDNRMQDVSVVFTLARFLKLWSYTTHIAIAVL